MIQQDQIELLNCVAERFQALSEVPRLRILLILRESPRNVSALTETLGMAQAAVSKHLAVLKAAGLVSSSKSKNNVIYRIADARVFEMCSLVCEGVFQKLRDQQALLRQFSDNQFQTEPARQGVSA